MDPMRAVGIILVVSFLLDRIAQGLFFVLDFSPAWRRFSPDSDQLLDRQQQASAVRRRKILYALVVGSLGIIVVAWYLHIRLLSMTGMIPPDPAPDDPTKFSFQPHALLDIVFTGLIFVAGADRLSEALKLLGGPGAEHGSQKGSSGQPIEITGKLILEGQQGPGRKDG